MKELVVLLLTPDNIAKAACDIWDAVTDQRRYDWSTYKVHFL